MTDEQPTQRFPGPPGPWPPSSHAGHRPPPYVGPPPVPPSGPLPPYVGPPPAPYYHQPGPPHEPPRPGLSLLIVLSLIVGVLGGAGGAWLMDNVLDDGGSDPAPSVVSDEPIPTDPAPLPANNTSVAAVAEEVVPSVVHIKVSSDGQQATGSGFVLDDRGHVVTNNHVVDLAADEGKITVLTVDEEEREARIVGRSPSYDLAVLEVPPAGLPPASVGSSDRLRVGEPVVAIGSPLGLTSTVTTGIVSALDRPVTAGGSGESSYMSAIQTDAAINPGNSGGPLVNLKGQVIGINSAIVTLGASLSGESGNIGLGFAIPMDQVRRTVRQLVQDGEAEYPIIGAKVRTDDSELAIIDSVEPGLPAEEAGIEQGDQILAVDGDPITGGGVDLIVEIRSHAPGDTITVEYERDGETGSVDITLAGQVG